MDQVVELPNELLWQILTFLPLKDLFCLLLTSKDFVNITNNDNFWKEMYEQRFGSDDETMKNVFPKDSSWKNKLKIASGLFTAYKVKYLEKVGPRAVTSSMNSKDVLLKCIFVGASNTGKSMILTRGVDNVFNESYLTTIGVDFKITTMYFNPPNPTSCKLQLWDTAGQERFQTITTSYYRGAHVMMFVFDMTRPETLEALENNIEIFKKNQSSSSCCCVLVGNKMDLYTEVEEKKDFVQADDILKFMSKHSDLNFDFIPTSARDGMNCEYLNEFIIRKRVSTGLD